MSVKKIDLGYSIFIIILKLNNQNKMSQHKCTQCHKLFNTTNDEEHRWCVKELLQMGLVQSYDDWIHESSKYYQRTKPKKIIKVKIKKSNI